MPPSDASGVERMKRSASSLNDGPQPVGPVLRIAAQAIAAKGLPHPPPPWLTDGAAEYAGPSRPPNCNAPLKRSGPGRVLVGGGQGSCSHASALPLLAWGSLG
uniref:Uncharacterized protein n=1 Tax=Eutreptiella gymnastica TaxID=73025 RepID=A0A7S4CC86_9EUGL